MEKLSYCSRGNSDVYEIDNIHGGLINHKSDLNIANGILLKISVFQDTPRNYWLSFMPDEFNVSPIPNID